MLTRTKKLTHVVKEGDFCLCTLTWETGGRVQIYQMRGETSAKELDTIARAMSEFAREVGEEGGDTAGAGSDQECNCCDYITKGVFGTVFVCGNCNQKQKTRGAE